MILLFHLLAVFAIACTQKLEVGPDCHSCLVINDSCYNATKVLELDAPFRKSVIIHKIGILRSNNTFYYSFEPAIEDLEYFKIGFINLDDQNQNGIFSSPDMLLNLGTFDIDQDNDLIYMGGSEGVFVFDTKELKVSPYSSRGDTIRQIFFKTNVNFVKNDDKGIIVKRGDNFKTLLEDVLVKDFVITKYDVVVFLNTFGLFVGKGDVRYRVSKNAFFRGLAIDLDGNVYAWWINEIYKVTIAKDLEYSKIEKVASLPVTIGSMTFDNDNNMLITVEKELIRLSPTDTGCKLKEEKKSEIVRVHIVTDY